MTTPVVPGARPDAPGVPLPGFVPDILPDMSPDALLIEAVGAAFEWVRAGVPLGPLGRLYVYLAPPAVHVASLVVIPASWFCPDPQTATVDTLEPPYYPGPLKRVLAVLS